MTPKALPAVKVTFEGANVIATYGAKGQFEIVVDDVKAVGVFRKIILAWQERQKMLKGVHPPEILMIDNLAEMVYVSKLDQALLLWAFGRLSFSSEKAVTLVKQIMSLYDSNPQILRPGSMVAGSYPPEYLEEFGKNITLTNKKPEILTWWPEGLEILLREYGGDPRNLFWAAKGDRIDYVKRYVENFPGVGHKMAEMLAMFFWEWSRENDPRLRHLIDSMEPCIGIDVWWLRLVRQFDLLVSWSSSRRDSTSWPLSCIVSAICAKHSLNHWNLGQGNYHIGSIICRAMRRVKRADRRPLFCLGNCPMNNYCKYIVPSGGLETTHGVMGWDKDRIIERVRFLKAK